MSTSSQPARSESVPLSVTLCMDMERGQNPVIFSFVIETPPNQLKMLARLADIVDEARFAKCSEKERNAFQEVLQKAKFTSSNSAFNALLKRNEGKRLNFVPRRRRFARQPTPRPEDSMHVGRTEGALDLISEEEVPATKGTHTTGDLPWFEVDHAPVKTKSTSTLNLSPCVQDPEEDSEEDEANKLSDASELSDSADVLDSEGPGAEESPQAGKKHASLVSEGDETAKGPSDSGVHDEKLPT
eukprot:TRINITY_DN11881_c0_g1_i7.p1 TRINITY_DN11881_c0_g1~~TRINITY_DN11881_c0_g1_i7.p1  ORF type:complete len:243 (+),score=43.23 TRINITY_DN11881_c0_g1_i7:133-861(+)